MDVPSAGKRPTSTLAFATEQLRRRPMLALVPLLPLLLAVPLLGPYLDPNLYGDESGYVRLAHHLLDGHYLTGRDDEVTEGPGYPNLWFGPASRS